MTSEAVNTTGKPTVLMFGWEFPPYSSGGLGTACYGLTKGLKNNNADVIFVVPRGDDSSASHVKLRIASEMFNKHAHAMNLKTLVVDSPLKAYMTPTVYSKAGKKYLYGGNLFEEVERFSQIAKTIAKQEKFDIIHCHDWITYKAGINAKKISGKPLVVHVHATEFDRSGGNINNYVYNIEKAGMLAADRVVCVSNLTRNIVLKKYGIAPEKVLVVHNAIEHPSLPQRKEHFAIKKKNKIVLFLGRITLQKGPDYFVEAAKKVTQKMSNVTFIIVGSGDMEAQIMEKAASLGLGTKVLFTGFMDQTEVDKAFRMADVYVMPSVSEPFGLTALEAMRNGTPCIISKQSGVSEVVKHCLKVDFWDVNELANKIVSTLKYPHLHNTLKENGSVEVKKFNWDNSAKKCVDVYSDAINNNLTRHSARAQQHTHHFTRETPGGCS